jgi:hypothetical protein
MNMDMKCGTSHDDSNSIEFPVIEIAAAIGLDSGTYAIPQESLSGFVRNSNHVAAGTLKHLSEVKPW